MAGALRQAPASPQGRLLGRRPHSIQELDVGLSPTLYLPFKVVMLTKPPEPMGQRAPLSSPSHETERLLSKGQSVQPHVNPSNVWAGGQWPRWSCFWPPWPLPLCERGRRCNRLSLRLDGLSVRRGRTLRSSSKVPGAHSPSTRSWTECVLFQHLQSKPDFDVMVFGGRASRR